MIYKVKDGFIVRKIGKQIMAVPTGQRTSQIHGMIALSESGALLWEALTKGADESDLAELLLSQYEVDRETAVNDVGRFLQGLAEQGALE
ncbi:MAG: PqqD family protein [Eubacteriales bacterium]